jgi:hypothetical protein
MISRARRRRAPSANGGTIEFAELLDPIAPPTVSATVEPAKPEEPEHVEQGEPATAPGAAASRFADAGLDDNRLPIGKPGRRWLRH